MPAPFRYMLRRVLCPWDAERIIDETVDWCVRQRIDEIMWITETSGMYKELLPLDDIRTIVDRLHGARKSCDESGVTFSLNPLTTLGHGDYGHDIAARHPGIEMMVGYDGGVSRACACPLSPVWRELMAETFALYAQTGPARLWLEDDFRYINHRPQVGFGCYCQRHMDAFGEHLGEPVTREALVEAMLAPGEPHPWRALWLDFLETKLNEVTEQIRDAVHAVSPATEMGWMSCNPAAHELEGRRYNPQMRALAGEKTAAIRMNTTHFFERQHIDLLMEDEALKKAIPQLPDVTTRCSEIETIPHSGYNTSAARIGAQATWAAVLGVPNQTMNIFDYVGTPISEVPIYDDMLRSRRDGFAALAEVFGALPRFRGIGIPGEPAAARYVHADERESGMSRLMAREGGWVDPLRAFGMPVHSTKDEAVTAMTGQAARCMSKRELETIFSRGVLLDASAVATLEAMGCADLAGVRIKHVAQQRERPTGPEQLIDPAFAGGDKRYTWTYGIGRFAAFELADDTRMISQVVDADGEFLYPGAVTFENRLGGRVVSLPYFFQGAGMDTYQKGPPRFFYSPYRRQQFHAIIRWLARGPAPMTVHAHHWTLPHRADGDGQIGLAVMNVNADDWRGVRLSCALDAPPKQVEWLDIDARRAVLPDSAWQHRDGELTVELDTNVPTYRTVAVIVGAA